MVKLLILLISRLSDTVEAWDEFRGNEIGYFLHGGDSPNCGVPLRPLVDAIGNDFSQLRITLLKLERLRKELCEDNPQGVSQLSCPKFFSTFLAAEANCVRFMPT